VIAHLFLAQGEKQMRSHFRIGHLGLIAVAAVVGFLLMAAYAVKATTPRTGQAGPAPITTFIERDEALDQLADGSVTFFAFVCRYGSDLRGDHEFERGLVTFQRQCQEKAAEIYREDVWSVEDLPAREVEVIFRLLADPQRTDQLVHAQGVVSAATANQ
jgi:hypothetical protein